MKRMLVLILTLVLAVTSLPCFAESVQYEEIPLPEGYFEHQNMQLKIWCEIFQMYQGNTAQEHPDGDYTLFNGDIIYREDSMRSNGDGIHVVDGGKDSPNGTYSVGMGASPEDENMWYVSFLYNQSAAAQTIIDNTIDMLKTTNAIFGGFGETADEETENLLMIAQALIGSGENIAIEAAGFVFATKYIGNQILIMVDTLEFYNAFYKGSIENYFVL